MGVEFWSCRAGEAGILYPAGPHKKRFFFLHPPSRESLPLAIFVKERQVDSCHSVSASAAVFSLEAGCTVPISSYTASSPQRLTDSRVSTPAL